MMFVTKASERGGNIQYPVMKNICKKRQRQYPDLKNIFKTRQTRGLGKQHGHLVEEARDNLAQGSFQVGACTLDILMLVMRKRRKKDVHVVGDEDDEEHEEENNDVDDHDEGG